MLRFLLCIPSLCLPQITQGFATNSTKMRNASTLMSPRSNEQTQQLKVAIIGSGNWGTVVSKIIGENTKKRKIFDPIVKMYVKEEMLGNEKLTDIINERKENVKYMKGMKIPDNVLAISNLSEVVHDADLLVFVVPHQYLNSILDEIKKGSWKKTVKAISLIKSITLNDDRPVLLSKTISDELNIECSVLAGSNIAKEIARESFSESTIGFENAESAIIWQQLFDTDYFKINCLQDIAGVEMCGALKNVIAVGVGLCDGSTTSFNTKSAIIRLGLEEMKKFIKYFYPSVLEETFLDSCGMADIIATCFGGRNAKCAAEFVRRNGKSSWEEIEKELLNGQKLQGIHTTREVYQVLERNKLKEDFPLFSVIYEISFEKRNPADIYKVFSTNKLRHIKLKNGHMQIE